MVGRFSLTLPPTVWREYFGYADEPNFPPRAAIAPTEPVAVVTTRPYSQGRERRFGLMRWGFLPGFVKDPANFPLLINARAESVLEKPSFRAAFKRRRCLIPADGYYASRAKQAYLIERMDRGPFALAGLFETYNDASGGEIDTVCIVTTAANAKLAPLNARMPAIVPRLAFRAWLDHDAPLGAALEALAPAPAELLRSILISSPGVRQSPVNTIR